MLIYKSLTVWENSYIFITAKCNAYCRKPSYEHFTLGFFLLQNNLCEFTIRGHKLKGDVVPKTRNKGSFHRFLVCQNKSNFDLVCQIQ